MPAYLKKAPLRGAFFVTLLTVFSRFCAGQPTPVPCSPPPEAERLEVAGVIDGDTLRLKNGDNLRLIGIDTPELGHSGGMDQPYARAAREELLALIIAGDSDILLQRGAETRDRHHRLLGHAFTPQGASLTAALLHKGLGYQAVVAPNLAHLACYRDAEASARRQRLGLWRERVRDAEELSAQESGFHLLHGRVSRVDTSRQAVWLTLQGEIAVKLPWAVWRAGAYGEPEDFLGRELEVRGWFYRHRGRLRVAVSHPAALRWL